MSRDAKEARESSVVRDSRLHPSPGGRPWLGECFFATFFAPKKRRRKVFSGERENEGIINILIND